MRAVAIVPGALASYPGPRANVGVWAPDPPHKKAVMSSAQWRAGCSPGGPFLLSTPGVVRVLTLLLAGVQNQAAVSLGFGAGAEGCPGSAPPLPSPCSGLGAQGIATWPWPGSMASSGSRLSDAAARGGVRGRGQHVCSVTPGTPFGRTKTSMSLADTTAKALEQPSGAQERQLSSHLLGATEGWSWAGRGEAFEGLGTNKQQAGPRAGRGQVQDWGEPARPGQPCLSLPPWEGTA